MTDFAPTISLLPASAATHLPTSIYNYMDENFFSELCIDPSDEGNALADTSEVVPLLNCQCDGYNFYGMPDIEFGLTVD